MKQRVIDRLEVERDRAAASLRTAGRNLWNATSQLSSDIAYSDMCQHYWQALAYNKALDILREELEQADAELDSDKS